jgi:transposase
LSLNSQNSNKPPSSDGQKKVKPKSLREVGKRPSGGQKGHAGHTLKREEKVDKIIRHNPPEKCDQCEKSLSKAQWKEVESRQVLDLPEEIRYEVTEHRVIEVECECGKKHRGEFPEWVRANVQYGPKVKASIVHLCHYQMIPVKRIANLINDFFGLWISQGTVHNSCKEAAERLQVRAREIATVLQMEPVLHADESGLRVKKKLHWMHVAVTKTLTWIGQHAKRGKEAIEELGILPEYKGTLIHDGWNAYRAIDCQHGLCNAHHLRELTYVHEE